MIILYKTPGRQFRVRITARNGKIVLTSESYKSRRAAINCVKAAAALENFASPDDGFSKRPDLTIEDRTGKEPKNILLRNY